MFNASKSNVKKKIEKSKENDLRQHEHEKMIEKLREELFQKFQDYKTTLNYMATDAPIEILCLPTSIEKALLEHGLIRIYDLFDVDFTKVKGLGVTRIRHLTTCLDQFFSML